jgi:hypothetical protein
MNINKQYDFYIRKREKLKKVLDRIDLYQKAINRMIIYEKKIYSDFKDSRMDIISSTATEHVRRLFPERGYKVKISYELSRNVNSRIRLFDRDGLERLIHMAQGKFLQSLIGYSGSTTMLLEMGMDKMYSDESFAVAHPDNMAKVELIFGELLGYLTQMFMVEQTPNGYRNLNRRESHLEFDPLTETTSIVAVKDFKGGDTEWTELSD